MEMGPFWGGAFNVKRKANELYFKRVQKPKISLLVKIYLVFTSSSLFSFKGWAASGGVSILGVGLGL